jgi:hypothetical protein
MLVSCTRHIVRVFAARGTGQRQTDLNGLALTDDRAANDIEELKGSLWRVLSAMRFMMMIPAIIGDWQQ